MQNQQHNEVAFIANARALFSMLNEVQRAAAIEHFREKADKFSQAEKA